MVKKYATKTKVVIRGEDVSNSVLAVSLPRFPDEVESVELKLVVDRLEVRPDGTLVVHVLEPLEDW